MPILCSKLVSASPKWPKNNVIAGLMSIMFPKITKIHLGTLTHMVKHISKGQSDYILGRATKKVFTLPAWMCGLLNSKDKPSKKRPKLTDRQTPSPSLYKLVARDIFAERKSRCPLGMPL